MPDTDGLMVILQICHVICCKLEPADKCTQTVCLFNVCVNQQLFPANWKELQLSWSMEGMGEVEAGGQGQASFTGSLTLQTLTLSDF